MIVDVEERASDSPFVERIWRSRSEGVGSFISIAITHWEMVVAIQNGKTSITVRGPETKATPSPVPEDAEFFGVIFKVGTFMPHLPVNTLVDTNGVLLDANNQSFWLKGSAWEIPTYDNADTFIERLMHEDLLVREPTVDDVLNGHQPDMSLRSAQRKFVRATGLTYRTVQQIQRARQAVVLLQNGTSILDTTYELGYFDQAHLTHSLRHFIGQTPSQLIDVSKAEQLSLLYKTDSPD